MVALAKGEWGGIVGMDLETCKITRYTSLGTERQLASEKPFRLAAFDLISKPPPYDSGTSVVFDAGKYDNGRWVPAKRFAVHWTSAYFALNWVCNHVVIPRRLYPPTARYVAQTGLCVDPYYKPSCTVEKFGGKIGTRGNETKHPCSGPLAEKMRQARARAAREQQRARRIGR